jgi:hypothetical protein
MEPIRKPVTRWQCPHCQRTRAKRADIARHMVNCWRNPAARSCFTCIHRDEPSGDGITEPFSPEGCRVGIVLPERGLPTHCPSHQP